MKLNIEKYPPDIRRVMERRKARGKSLRMTEVMADLMGNRFKGSGRTMARMKFVMENGTPEEIEMVETGQFAVSWVEKWIRERMMEADTAFHLRYLDRSISIARRKLDALQCGKSPA